MIDTIKEGVVYNKVGGDGMAGREASAGSLERAHGKPDERCLDSVDSSTLSVEQCCFPFYTYVGHMPVLWQGYLEVKWKEEWR